MNILVVLIPVSMLLVIGAGVALFWAVDHGQFDDMDTPGILPLLDSDDALRDAGACGANRTAVSRVDTAGAFEAVRAEASRGDCP